VGETLLLFEKFCFNGFRGMFWILFVWGVLEHSEFLGSEGILLGLSYRILGSFFTRSLSVCLNSESSPYSSIIEESSNSIVMSLNLPCALSCSYFYFSFGLKL